MPVASVRVRLRVSPGADRTEIVGRRGDVWKVRVTAVAERGKANAAVERLLADVLGVPRAAVSVVSGRTGRDKVVEISGLDPAAVARRLAGEAT
jgi:uncharacterized protein (TIGR00251 family)